MTTAVPNKLAGMFVINENMFVFYFIFVEKCINFKIHVKSHMYFICSNQSINQDLQALNKAIVPTQFSLFQPCFF